ncbi:MAG: MotE family protein [Pseudomonadota bacterium]
MRYVSFALLFLCITVTGLRAQTRAADDNLGAAGAPQADFPAQAQLPVDLHAQGVRHQATEARAKAEARMRALRALPEVRMFCANNVSTAGAARVAWQAAKLEELEARLQQKIDELEAKRAEYEDWLRKRDEALKKASADIVAIYAKMEPEAAANELAQMDDTMAAAVLSKLNTRTASSILGQMDPARAAQLTDKMISANSGDGKKS